MAMAGWYTLYAVWFKQLVFQNTLRRCSFLAFLGNYTQAIESILTVVA